MVGAEGFEPPTLCSQSRCATRLRHAPMPDRPLTSGAAMLSGWRRNVIKCDRNVREFRRLRSVGRDQKPWGKAHCRGASAEIRPKDDASRRIRMQSIARQSVHRVSTKVSTRVSGGHPGQGEKSARKFDAVQSVRRQRHQRLRRTLRDRRHLSFSTNAFRSQVIDLY